MKKLLLIAALFAVACTKSDYKYEALYAELPFEMPRVERPTFPDRTVNIEDYGGIGDGQFLNTGAFEQAIADLSNQGGGRLVVGDGLWLTGPIVLRSNIDLHIEKGGLVLFSSDRSLYPVVMTHYEGREELRCQSPLSAKEAVNIAITGEGSINGSGHAWRPLKKEKVTERQWQKFLATPGGVLLRDDYWVPSENHLRGEEWSRAGRPAGMPVDSIKDFLRPTMVSLVECKNVLLEGVLFENSPAWNLHPIMCENLIIDGVFVRNPGYSQNGDGMDIESCKNVLVVNSVIDAGDDAICVKSGRDAEGRKRGRPTENMIVDNCKVFQGHGGFVVGSEMSGGVRNISVRNCTFIGTDVGLRFKSQRGRGGMVENIFIQDISMIDIVTDALTFDLYYGNQSVSEVWASGGAAPERSEPALPVDETTPCFQNITIKNVVARNSGRSMFMRGLPEMNVKNVALENVVFDGNLGVDLANVDGITFKNVEVFAKRGDAIKTQNVKNFNNEQ